MENQEIKKTINKALVIGVLKEKKIDFKVTSNGRKMATGNLIVVCDTPYGKGEVEVGVLQYADKKDGTPNKLYKGLETLASSYKSIKETDEANADTIKIEGSLVEDIYYSANKGDTVERKKIRGTFFNRVEANTPHECKVAFEGCITKITPVENELEVEIVGIGHSGMALPLTATIPQELVGAFQGGYMVGCSTSLNIAFLNVVVVKEVQEKIGFGEGFGEKINSHINKRIVFGGSEPKYQGTPEAVSAELVKQGLSLREANIRTKREEGENRAKGGAGNTGSSFGQVDTNGMGAQGFNAPSGGFGVPMGGFGFPAQ